MQVPRRASARSASGKQTLIRMLFARDFCQLDDIAAPCEHGEMPNARFICDVQKDMMGWMPMRDDDITHFLLAYAATSERASLVNVGFRAAECETSRK